MKNITIIFLCLILLYSCSVNKFSNELEFGNSLAQAGLWKEALFRWQKHLEEGNETASVHNNIAIAMEQMGRFEDAEKEYQKALKLEPKNATILSNYDAFKKLMGKKNEKTKK